MPPLGRPSPRGRGIWGDGTAIAGKDATLALPGWSTASCPSHLGGRWALTLPVLLLALSGCKLIDQTTFAPAPEATPVATAAPVSVAARVDPRTPLLVIDYTMPNPDYEGVLGYAVRAAQARDRNVQFDVVAVAPSTEQMVGAQVQAAGIMRSLIADRVPSERIHLGLLADPGLAANQVRVYVR